MLKFLSLSLMLCFAVPIMAQDSEPIDLGLPVIDLDKLFFDTVEVELTDFIPMFATDDKLQIIGYFDYLESGWKNIPYPEQATNPFVAEFNEGLVFSDDENWLFNQKTNEWEIYEQALPEKRCGHNRWEQFLWYLTDDDGIYTFCNTNTLETVHLTYQRLTQNCQTQYIANINNESENSDGFIFYGQSTKDTKSYNICVYHIETNQVIILGAVFENFTSFKLEYLQANQLVLSGWTNTDFDRELGNIRTDIFTADIYQGDSLKHLTRDIDEKYTNIDRIDSDIAPVFIWAEQLNKIEEGIFKYDSLTQEIELLFKREQNYMPKTYFFSLSLTGNFIAIHEYHFYFDNFQGVALSVYSLDGDILYSESFLHPLYRIYWLEAETLLLFVCCEYGLDIYPYILSGIQAYQVTVDESPYPTVSYSYLQISNRDFLLLQNDHVIYLYDIYSHDIIPFIQLPEGNYCFEYLAYFSIFDCRSYKELLGLFVKVKLSNVSGD